MPVRRLMQPDDARWDAYVDAHPQAHQYHRSAWKRIIERAFSHDTHYLFSESSSGAINGVLPLARLRSRMFGDFLVSVPYVNYGGCCADNEDVEQELLREGVRVANELSVDHLEVRTETSRDMGLQVRSAKASMRLPLGGSSERLWETFPAKLRSQIKRAQKEGMDGARRPRGRARRVLSSLRREHARPRHARLRQGVLWHRIAGAPRTRAGW